MKPAPEQHAYIAGEQTHFKELPKNQVLNFYVPANVLGVAQQPGGEVAKIVEEPQGQQVASTLPQTASSLPAIALGGLISLLGALGLAIRRRLS